MSSEEFRERLDNALETAVAGNADLDDIEDALSDAQHRVEVIRATRGEA